MLRTLILENFKAFRQRQVIPLAPITLIYGANSAGKSSIFQALLLLKQTLGQQEDSTRPLILHGDLVNAGSFENLTFGRNGQSVLEIAPVMEQNAWRLYESRFGVPFGKIGREYRDPYSPQYQLTDEEFEEMTNRATNSVENAIVPGYSLSPHRQLGAGFRFGPGLRLDEVRYYWDDVDLPAFILRSVSPSFLLGTNSCTLASLASYRHHSLWTDLLTEFKERCLVPYHTALNNAARLLDIYDPSTQSFDPLSPPTGGRSTSRSKPPRTTQELRQIIYYRIDRLANYTLDHFLEDVQAASHHSVPIRNFLPVENVWIYKRDEFAPEPLDPDLFNLLPNPIPLPNLTNVTLAVSEELRLLLQSMIYIGPLRPRPERFYAPLDHSEARPGTLARLIPEIVRRDKLTTVNRYLSPFGYSLDVKFGGGELGEQVFVPVLTDLKTNTPAYLSDVGFGIGQSLPILCQILLADEQIVLIEQPELHLHPRLQGEIASLLVHSLIYEPHEEEERLRPGHTDFWGRLPKAQFVVETHSEHLLLRFQRLIREGTLRAHEISVLYVQKEKDGASCLHLRLDDDGDFIDEWPDGFFEEGYREIFSSR